MSTRRKLVKEGKVEEHSRAWVDLKDSIIHVEGRINALDAKIDRRIDALDAKVDRFRDELSGDIKALDQRLSGDIKTLDQKLSKYALWLIGIQATIFAAVIATILK